MQGYCASRFVTLRRPTREVHIGNVGVGGDNPIRIQSMTTALTTNVEATVKQTRALVEAGCEIVRITAPNLKAAQALKDIRKQLRDDKIDVPLVADIHFLPSAAMEAAEHVEKVRVNPGNYADKKKFQVKEYSDEEYKTELQKLHESFTPLVLRCKELGRSMRIGTNHGSLSDRIMNRYGDSPWGMVESALEFIRIAEHNGYKDMVLSMKASNPKVMIQAYRLVVAKMEEENMHYPLHLGVTEAGDGEDGRIKSTIGIGSLLADGLGDTIRVSLTEDPVYEIPVARALVDKTAKLWKRNGGQEPETKESINPYEFRKRITESIEIPTTGTVSYQALPRTLIKPPTEINPVESMDLLNSFSNSHQNTDTPLEGWILSLASNSDMDELIEKLGANQKPPTTLFLEINEHHFGDWVAQLNSSGADFIPIISWDKLEKEEFEKWANWSSSNKRTMALGISAKSLAANTQILLKTGLKNTIVFPQTDSLTDTHLIGEYRLLVATLEALGWKPPIWIRSRPESYISQDTGFLNDLLEASILAGSLLADGIGDVLSIERIADPNKSLQLAYNVLQGAGARISKTEYVACPSCGRTLFDLQSTTQMIRQNTQHLKGVKVAVMGCIVNGPGEMADADFGYVGGAPGKVNLYIGKDCVEHHVPEADAVSRLIDLIRQEGKWIEPPEKVQQES
ncbi:MAG: 4-hydroxy-3-methylbut-2-en-1-yl diphosphate synthase [Opitutaceae bacterium]|nr:4-hydroxy-3-methylbut-2-en-1-yl diphosphate synthase [Opitutaceae bacterium]